jgi:hypothetical protein
MPRRLRLGRASGLQALGVAAAAVLILALVVTGRSLRGDGTRPSAPPARPAATDAPYRIGGRVTCPLAHPVLATADGRSYPPGHPARPPRNADPVACYGTAAQAAAAGYAPAPPPAGVLELGGVYLVPTSGRLHRRCQEAAELLGFAVPCPTLLPQPPPNAPPPTLCDRRSPCSPEAGFLLEVSGFVVPPGYVGTDPATGARLAIGAARPVAAFPVACSGERPVATVKVRGTSGRLSLCPHAAEATVHLGSVLLRWRERGVVMVVSVSGNTDLNRRLVQALAAHLALVPPSD